MGEGRGRERGAQAGASALLALWTLGCAAADGDAWAVDLTVPTAPAPAAVAATPPVVSVPGEVPQEELGERFYPAALDSYGAMRYREAYRQVVCALLFDPSSGGARELRERLLWILGIPRADGERLAKALREHAPPDPYRQETLRVAALLSEGREHLAQGRRAAAEACARRALESVRWFPFARRDLERGARLLLEETWPRAEDWPG
ncbi:MAG: hypothetical protein AB7N76_29555 [Planctomycetota bacterium]